MVFTDQGEFEAMKLLSGWEAARCNDNQFHAEIKVSRLPEPFSSYRRLTNGLNKERRKKMKNSPFAIAHFCV